jgi:hypothetical protein
MSPIEYYREGDRVGVAPGMREQGDGPFTVQVAYKDGDEEKVGRLEVVSYYGSMPFNLNRRGIQGTIDFMDQRLKYLWSNTNKRKVVEGRLVVRTGQTVTIGDTEFRGVKNDLTKKRE